MRTSPEKLDERLVLLQIGQCDFVVITWQDLQALRFAIFFHF